MLFTIGFTKKTAEQFFTLLKTNKVKRVIDVRANNTSQLAGYAKKVDLAYFLREIIQVEYIQMDDLAPDPKLLKAYRSGDMRWEAYAEAYLSRLYKVRAESVLNHEMLAQGCFLCSEHEPHFCHRRLAAEYINQQWGDSLRIQHLT